MRKITLIALLGLAACGADDGTSGDHQTPGANNDGRTDPNVFTAEAQTPGIYRDTFRSVDAVNAEQDDALAVERLRSDLTIKLQNTEGFDTLGEEEAEVVRGLYILALRSTEATSHNPKVARDIGTTVLARVLELDRARPAWNKDRAAAQQVKTAQPNAKLIAEVTEVVLTKATQAPIDAQGNALPGLSPTVAAQCASPTTRAMWIPGQGTSTWVPEYCSADKVLPGYCESDRYVEGYCWDVWVDDCPGGGGRYEDRGYYDYYCYSSSDCRYVWRQRWVWVPGNYCRDGYYREECTSGRYEPGLCYPDQTVPGYCVEGHYTTIYPSGSWSFRSSGSADCDTVIPAQTAVARSSAQILSGALSADISDLSWRAAVQNLVSLQDVPQDGALVDAVVQIVAAAKSSSAQ